MKYIGNATEEVILKGQFDRIQVVGSH
jgi:hypothetical protein